MPTDLCRWCGSTVELGSSSAGADVTGTVVASPPATAGPTLHQATQAAAKELWQLGPINSAALCNDVARIAVEAAWALLEQPLQDAHNRNHLLEIEIRDLQHRLEAGADALEELHTAQTQNAELKRLRQFERAIRKAEEITYDTAAALAMGKAIEALDRATEQDRQP